MKLVDVVEKAAIKKGEAEQGDQKVKSITIKLKE